MSAGTSTVTVTGAWPCTSTVNCLREIAAGSSGSNRCHFRTAVLPAVADLAPVSVSLHLASLPQPKLALEETILAAVGTVARAIGTNHTRPRRPKAAATRRMTAAIDYIETQLATDLSLTELSAYVGMSKYHFLRTFTQASGMTPHQYILGRRLRAAAIALRANKEPVARIALDQGFGDLSTFNHYFHRVMGAHPRRIGRDHEYGRYATGRSVAATVRAQPRGPPLARRD